MTENNGRAVLDAMRELIAEAEAKPPEAPRPLYGPERGIRRVDALHASAFGRLDLWGYGAADVRRRADRRGAAGIRQWVSGPS